MTHLEGHSCELCGQPAVNWMKETKKHGKQFVQITYWYCQDCTAKFDIQVNGKRQLEERLHINRSKLERQQLVQHNAPGGSYNRSHR